MIASYRRIGGPDGLLARREPFRGNTMSAYHSFDGTYVVLSYATPIATVKQFGEPEHNRQRYSQTTSRHQGLCRAWL